MVWKCFPLNLHNWSNSWKWKEEMTTLAPYEEALQRILQLQDLLIEEQKEVLRLRGEIDNLAIVKYLNGVTISKLYAELGELKEIQVKRCGSSYDTVCPPHLRLQRKGTREMNSNELADELETYDWIPDDEVWIKKATTMLRQQQAEIEALKEELKEEGALAQAWILYATKVQMLMPTMCEPNIAKELGWSTEYLKGYNDAVRDAKLATKKASEK